MKSQLRRCAVIGFSFCLLLGPLAPMAAAIGSTDGQGVVTVTPTPVIGSSTAPPGSRTGSATTSPRYSTSYPLVPDQFSLTISPTRLIIGSAEIGNVQKLVIVNRGQAPASVTVSKRNFTVALDGSLTYEANAPFAASGWITLSPTTFTVPSGAAQTVNATVKAPAGAEPGDHQVAVVFLVAAGETSGNIKINRGIASPVYITAPGPITDTTTLSGLHAPGFATGGPVTITATLHNTGTVHRDFRGSAPLKILAVGASSSFPDFTVPRDSVRNVSTTWNPPFMCICHPSVQIANTGAAVQISTIRVIIFPWPTFAIAIAALFLLILLIKLSRRHYRRSIVKAATAMNRPVSGGDA